MNNTGSVEVLSICVEKFWIRHQKKIFASSVFGLNVILLVKLFYQNFIVGKQVGKQASLLACSIDLPTHPPSEAVIAPLISGPHSGHIEPLYSNENK